MNPGIRGTKMLLIRFKNSLAGVAFFARMASWRALPSPTSPWGKLDFPGCSVAFFSGAGAIASSGAASRALNASVTWAAFPGPRMICSSGPDWFTPMTPGSFFRDSRSTS